MLFSKYEHDVFISHAVEDKLIIANELFERLEEAGLNIWYSGKGLRIGDSIESVIRKNLSKSRYAVVIFSQNYLSKNWTMKELYLLLGHEIAQRKVILPILLNVTVDDLKEKDISIADKFAIPIEKGVDYIVEKILEEVKGIKPAKPKKSKAKTPRYTSGRKVFVASLLLTGLFALSYFVYGVTIADSHPDNSFVRQIVDNRIRDLQASVEKQVKTAVNQYQAVSATQKDIVQAFNEFDKLKTYYRNEYEFSNGFKELRFKKNVESDLGINVDALTAYNSYGFKNCSILLSPRYRDGLVDCINYTLFNSEPLTYTITDSRWLDNGDYEVTVSYQNNIRALSVTLIFPAQDFPKRYQVSLRGFSPTEKFIFHEESGTWSWSTLE